MLSMYGAAGDGCRGLDHSGGLLLMHLSVLV
jgi:hypothetical protein